MSVEIFLPGMTSTRTVATDGDASFVAAEIRKMASQGDGFAVLHLADDSLLILSPASTWVQLSSVPPRDGTPEPI